MSSLKFAVALVFIAVSVSAAAKGKTADRPSKRKPQSLESCKDSSTEVQQSFAEDFKLAREKTGEVQLKFYQSADIDLISATHPEFCGVRGCEVGLYRVLANQCVQNVLNFSGDFIPIGKPESRYRRIMVSSRHEAVDGKRVQRKIYELSESASRYVEVK